MRLLLLLLFLATGGLAHAQDEVIRDFIKTHRRGSENAAVKVPGWLIGLASDIGATATDDPDEKVLFRLISNLGTTRVITYLNEDFPHPGESIGNLLYSLERYRGFERWAEVRTRDGERISLSIRYEKKKVREILAVVREADRTVLVSSRAHLSAEELGQLVNELETL
jgi:hypothetical protein